MPNIGIITEQGDLGLGFDNLNDKDAKAYNEATKPHTESDSDKSDNK